MAYLIRPEAAARAVRLLDYHQGDISLAAHDVWICLQSLGSYTDRKSEAVHDIFRFLQRVPADRLPTMLETLRSIAAKAVQS